jgi:hypothetical protein
MSIAALLLVVLCATAAAAEPASGTPDQDAARELFRLVNQEREKSGRASLHWDDRLADAALRHAYLMAERRELSHQFANEPSLRLRLAKTSIRLDRSAENVAYDSTIDGAHAGLMHSPGHRANILSPDYNALGIGIVKRGEYYYVVQDFAHRLPEVSVSQVEDEIAQAFDRLRRQARATPLTRRNATILRDAACAMARQDEVNARGIQQGARYVVAFTISEPEKLPADVFRFRSNDDLGSYAVGVCFERSPTYPSGIYWAVMTFFSKASDKGR